MWAKTEDVKQQPAMRAYSRKSRCCPEGWGRMGTGGAGLPGGRAGGSKAKGGQPGADRVLPGRQCEGWDVLLCDFSGSLDNGFWQSSAKRQEHGTKGEASIVLPLPLSSSWHFMATRVSFGLAASHQTAPSLEGVPPAWGWKWLPALVCLPPLRGSMQQTLR